MQESEPESTDGNSPPSTCENPEEDCYRKPVVRIQWSEDYTSDAPERDVWLCPHCEAMFNLGTRTSQVDMVVKARLER